MRPEEKVEAARLVGSALRGATGVVREIHGTTSSAVFGTVRRCAGPLAAPVVTPVEIVHDTVARSAYGITGRALEAGATATGVVAARTGRPLPKALGRAGDMARAASAEEGPAALADHPRARILMAVVHGFYGDRLAASGSQVSYGMTLRRSGRDVPVTTEGLAQAYADASRTVVVFVHGFIGTEQMWKRRSDRDDDGHALSYGRRLEADGDVSAVWVRYNTGLRVSANGRSLGGLLEQLVEHWPVPVERLVLVGHSMGGLVSHSAIAQAPEDSPWVRLTSDVITLGTPHHGTPLERSANAVARELAAHDASRWAADLIRFRSDGIRDLRHGNIVEEDWQGHDPEDPTDRRTGARPHGHVRHLAVVATIARDPDSRWADYLGDLVVGRDSARGWADPDDAALGSSETVHLGGLNHLDLLGHPRVHALLAERLGVADPTGEDAREELIAGA